MSLGELAVANRARDAGLGTPGGSAVVTVVTVEENEVRCKLGGGGVYYGCSEMVGWQYQEVLALRQILGTPRINKATETRQYNTRHYSSTMTSFTQASI